MKRKDISKLPFLGENITKKSAHPFFGAWLLLLVHVRFTPSQGPKGPKFFFFHKSNHGIVTVKCDHGKRPFDMGQLRGP